MSRRYRNKYTKKCQTGYYYTSTAKKPEAYSQNFSFMNYVNPVF